MSMERDWSCYNVGFAADGGARMVLVEGVFGPQTFPLTPRPETARGTPYFILQPMDELDLAFPADMETEFSLN